MKNNMKRFYHKRKPKAKKQEVALDERQALLAFTHPVMYPILLSCYKEENRTEEELKADIKTAREYLITPKASSTESKDSSEPVSPL